jgi:error-prone DNA polymerase
MPTDYAELHCLTNFTFLTGASHPDELVNQAHALGYKALAITDECSVAGVVRAHLAAKECGLKLIVGSEFTLDDGLRLVLLAMDFEGYANLSQLITRGRRNAEKGRYQLSRTDAAEFADHSAAVWLPHPRSNRVPAGTPSPAPAPWIALENLFRTFSTGHIPVAVPRASMHSPARTDVAHPSENVVAFAPRTALLQVPTDPQTPESATAHWFKSHFPNRAWIAVELHREGIDDERRAQLERISLDSGLPLLAAGDVHMHVPERKPLQDTLTAIRLGTTIADAGFALFQNAERHLRPCEELVTVYRPEWISETVRLADACTFSLDELRYHYPEDDVPPGELPANYLRRLTYDGMQLHWPGGAPERVIKLVEHELAIIAELRYENYFLTVHDIVRFARQQGILCQGRGSAANSAVCFCLGITSVDPSRMEMLFERFVSKERNEPPDIDVDFEHERREEVMQYIYNRYGRDRAAIAATVISYRRRSAIRDVGKALGLSLAQIEALSGNLAWWDKGVPEQQLREAGLDPHSRAVRLLLHLVRELRGFPRHLSQHVGGFVISKGPLTRLVPIENAAMEDRTVIQWDKDDLDAVGLMKVDVLALGMLSAIRRTFQLLKHHRRRDLTLATIPAEDPATYRMIQKADTVGVFQIESRAQMSMLPRLKPERFYDLVIEVAIVRPGPIQGQMIHPYLRRRQGLEPEEYPSEGVKEVLKRTLGVPLFQEQVIKLAMVAAGFTAGEADQLRRAIAAWRRHGTLEKFREKLLTGMQAHGYSEEFAERIYQQILGFGEYGFPESHAASFALLAYASAWLKCHEPAAFLAALLNSQPMGFYAPAQLVADARRHHVEVRPVDVTVSDWDCTLEPQDDAFALRLGMRMVKGLAIEAAERIVAARRRRPFAHVDDLARRAALDRRALDQLAAAGALAPLSGDRHRARWAVLGTEEPLPLFAEPEAPDCAAALRIPTEGEEIAADYAHVGLTLGRHPLALLTPHLKRLRTLQFADLPHVTPKRPVAIVGLVTTRQHPGSAKGTIFLTLEDETGTANIIVWPSLVERFRKEVVAGRLLRIHGHVEREGDVIHVIARRIEDHSHLLGSLVTWSRDFC